MPPISDVAADLLAGPVPVLLLDTCALLDLIRAPLRRSPWQLAAALRVDVLTAATPAACRILCASITAREFADHVAGEQRQLEQHLLDLQDRVGDVQCACDMLTIPFAAPAFFPSPLPASLVALAQRLLTRSTALDPDLPARERAFQRVLDRRRPARSGAIKDSVMVEEYLALCGQLRVGSFTPPAAFLSSNTSDFCEGTSRTLHPDLFGDFAAVGLTFCRNWPEATAALGL